jgi:hypothetical protein
MRIVVILILGYFVLGFAAVSFVVAGFQKPKKPAALTAETPPFQTPLLVALAAGFLVLPVVGYRRSLKQGKFLHLGVKFWLWGPLSLCAAGVVAALITLAAAPSFFG